jgi:IS5 family transposase
MKLARSCTKKLKTYLGRVIRDIERKCQSPDKNLRSLLETANRIFNQQRQDKNNVHGVHEPNLERISKGKAHKRYEFGAKVSVDRRRPV